MNIQDWYELDEMEQTEAIWAAKKISEKTEPGYLIQLYQIGKLYIEVKVDLDTKMYEYIKPIPSPWN